MGTTLQTLRRTGWGRLARDCFQRFRYADGFSHCRALAFQITLTLLPGIIAVVGLATLLRAEHFREALRQSATRLAPGPAGDVIVTAVQHGQRAAGGGARTALAFGLLAALVSATTAMGQVERGANRIYGVERDRPTLRKYTVGFLLACSAGLAMVLAIVLIVAGQDITEATRLPGMLEDAWGSLRWPVAVVLLVVAVALLFRASPRRHQPSASWLAAGSAVSVLLGLAFAAQLEAVRAGQPAPITGERVNRTGSQRSSLRGDRVLTTWR
ncbi:MAG TPA: YhjD/YihY/BrkB family envelope integrity protein [Actinomycetes bacterium]|jgi:YihY family inner membrane protein|nr:YhjD/YihY/BrkB family envelope integrity protein [Actinomycetes bacterium]